MSADVLAATFAGAFCGLLAFCIIEAAAYLEGGNTLVAETVAEQARLAEDDRGES